MVRSRGSRAILAAALLLGACTAGDGAEVPDTSSTTIAVDFISVAAPSSTTAATSLPAEPPVYGGVVVVADDQEPPVLNPYMPGGDNHIVATVSQAHMAGAFEFAPSGELQPDVASLIPSAKNGGVVQNDDGTMSVTWTIRDEAVWSDGVPISGADFAFSIEYQKADCSVRQPDARLEGEVEHVGPKTMTYRFDSTGFQFETALPWIVPEHVVAGTGLCTDWNTTAWPAAGPFVLDEWVQGESLTLVRNKKYWKSDDVGGQLPYLDRIEFRFIPEWAEAVDRFAAGEIDVVQPPAVSGTVEEMGAIVGVEVQAVAGPVVDFFAFQFGPDRRNELSLTEHRDFRAAVRDTIDRGKVVDAMWGTAYSSLGLDLTSPDAEDVVTVADVCASSIVDCSEGDPPILFSTVANSEPKVAGADVVVEQLSHGGFEVELVYEDNQLVFGVPVGGWWDVTLTSMFEADGTAGLLEQMTLLDPNRAPGDGHGFFGWGSPVSVGSDPETVERVEAILAQARSSVDAEEVGQLADELFAIALDEVIMIPLAGRPEIGAVWASNVGGFEMNSTGSTHTWNIELWHRLDR